MKWFAVGLILLGAGVLVCISYHVPKHEGADAVVASALIVVGLAIFFILVFLTI